MKRRRYLPGLIVALIVAPLLFAQSFAATNRSAVVAGAVTCRSDAPYHANPKQPGGYALTDALFTCEFVATNGDARGTGTAEVLLSADFDANFRGLIWGSYTIRTTDGAWAGAFDGFNGGIVSGVDTGTAVLGQALGSGAYQGLQMTQAIDHMMGTGGSYIMQISQATDALNDPFGNAFLCKGGGWKVLVHADGTPFKNQKACLDYANNGGRLAYPDKSNAGHPQLLPKIRGCPTCPSNPGDHYCCMCDNDYDCCDLACLLTGGEAFPPFR